MTTPESHERETQRAFAELRSRAERCLAMDAPTPAFAHGLAISALEALRSLERIDASGQPYRDMGDTLPTETASLVVLERALEQCEERLRVALAEIVILRGRSGSSTPR